MANDLGRQQKLVNSLFSLTVYRLRDKDDLYAAIPMYEQLKKILRLLKTRNITYSLADDVKRLGNLITFSKRNQTNAMEKLLAQPFSFNGQLKYM